MSTDGMSNAAAKNGDSLPSEASDGGGGSQPVRRWPTLRSAVAATILALLSLLAAMAAARGPAIGNDSVVRWPTKDDLTTLKGPAPHGRPLMLAALEPSSLHLSAPCSAVANPGRRVILATARDPGGAIGLMATGGNGTLDVTVGRLPALSMTTDSTSASCRLTLQLDAGVVRSSIGEQTRQARLAEMPAVTGLFSDLVSRQDAGGLRVTVEPSSTDSRPSNLQWWATTSALMAGLSSAWVLLRRSGTATRVGSRPSRTPVDVLDGAVIASLCWWTVVGAPGPDDGWLLGSTMNRSASGTFAAFYDSANASSTLGFLHSMMLWGMGSVSTAMWWLRLPALLCGIAAWRICRGVLHRRAPGRLADSGPGGPAASRRPEAALASILVVTWMANNNTLRPEPLVALLLAASIWVGERLRAAPSARLIAGGSACVVLALTIHPTGVVVAVPLLFAIGEAWKAIRREGTPGLLAAGATAFLSFGFALLVVTADSDLERWSDATSRLPTDGTNGPLRELERYRLLFSVPGWGPPVRRFALLLAVAVLVLAMLRVLLLPRTRSAPVLGALALAFGFVSLAASPSKWPNHLGVLAPLAAVAAATEVQRYRHAAGTTGGWRGRTLGIAAVVLMGATIVLATLPATALDLWTPYAALGDLHPWWRWTGISLVVIIVAGSSIYVVRHGRTRPLKLAATLPTLLGATAVVATLALFTLDGFTSSRRWTVARQSLGLQTRGCGLAGAVLAGDPRAIHELPAAPGADSNIAGFQPVGNPTTREGLRSTAATSIGGYTSPWENVPSGPDGPPLVVWSGVSGNGGSLAVEWGDTEGHSVGTATPLERSAQERGASLWRAHLIRPPSRSARRVRLRVVVRTSNASDWVGFVPPATMTFQHLDEAISDRSTLLSITMGMILPCNRNPTIVDGVAEIPELLLGSRQDVESIPGSRVGHPFLSLSDLFEIRPLVMWDPEGAFAPTLLLFNVQSDRFREFRPPTAARADAQRYTQTTAAIGENGPPVTDDQGTDDDREQ